jgi:hypothetical protein
MNVNTLDESDDVKYSVLTVERGAADLTVGRRMNASDILVADEQAAMLAKFFWDAAVIAAIDNDKGGKWSLTSGRLSERLIPDGLQGCYQIERSRKPFSEERLRR